MTNQTKKVKRRSNKRGIKSRNKTNRSQTNSNQEESSIKSPDTSTISTSTRIDGNVQTPLRNFGRIEEIISPVHLSETNSSDFIGRTKPPTFNSSAESELELALNDYRRPNFNNFRVLETIETAEENKTSEGIKTSEENKTAEGIKTAERIETAEENKTSEADDLELFKTAEENLITNLDSNIYFRTKNELPNQKLGIKKIFTHFSNKTKSKKALEDQANNNIPIQSTKKYLFLRLIYHFSLFISLSLAKKFISNFDLFFNIQTTNLVLNSIYFIYLVSFMLYETDIINKNGFDNSKFICLLIFTCFFIFKFFETNFLKLGFHLFNFWFLNFNIIFLVEVFTFIYLRNTSGKRLFFKKTFILIFSNLSLYLLLNAFKSFNLFTHLPFIFYKVYIVTGEIFNYYEGEDKKLNFSLLLLLIITLLTVYNEEMLSILKNKYHLNSGTMETVLELVVKNK